jgi:hypothetical protein
MWLKEKVFLSTTYQSINTWEAGSTIFLMIKASKSGVMGLTIKAIFLTVKNTEKAYINLQMGVFTKDPLSKTNSTDKECLPYLRGIIEDNFKRENSTERAYSNGKMDHLMTVTTKMTENMVLENT